ncbi:MAG: hypothetical protein M1616_06355 [Candidatus Thermoplasmatota archaeon]|nr:hypothetical protein [Candidatus Thermoplasmatota archaeon]
MEGVRRVNIAALKTNFARTFPEHPLAKILLSEPSTLTDEEFLAKAQTWLAFFQGRERK